MVTLKELFNPGRTVSNLGALKFGQSVFRDETRYPHWEMDKCLQMYERRPIVNSGVNQLVSFIIGEDIVAASDDPKTHEFLNTWLAQRPKLKGEVRKMVTVGVVAGNVYAEPTYRPMSNGQPVLDNVFCIPDPSRVFYNLDTEATESDYWIYEVPIEIKVFPWRGDPVRPKFYRVNYVRGSVLFQKMVYGIALDRKKLFHLGTNWSRDGLYGRSFLASAIDNEEILAEILKNLGIISRSRALNIKLLSIGTEEDRATPEDTLRLQQEFKERREDEHIVLNKPVREISLSHQGQYDPMDNTIEWMRKEQQSGLIPNFLTPWGDQVNRATSNEVKIPFELHVKSLRQDFLDWLNDVIIGELRKSYDWLADDARIEFGVLDLTSREEKMTYAGQLFTNNALTLNEYREAAGYDAVEGGDVWANQLATPPVDRMTITQTTTMDEPAPAVDPTNLAPAGDPAVQPTNAQPKISAQQPTQERLGPYRPVKTHLERVLAKFRTKEDVAYEQKPVDSLSGDELFGELAQQAKQVQRLLKREGTTKKIVTLTKKDKKDVQSIVLESIDSAGEADVNLSELKTKITEAVQATRKGKAKYDPYIIERIARTELSSLRELTKLHEWARDGYTKVKYVARITTESSPACKKKNGKVYTIEKAINDAEVKIPTHPNCRCGWSLHK